MLCSDEQLLGMKQDTLTILPYEQNNHNAPPSVVSYWCIFMG
ncbi:hypothetical protein [Dapis sp. BLCC M172]